MRSTQVTTWRKYTQAEKKAYRARVRRRTETRHALKARVFHDIYSGRTPDPRDLARLNATPAQRHYFADNFGSRVPTARVNGDVL